MLYLIKLKRLLNNPSLLASDDEWLNLTPEENGPILIYGSKVAELLLRNASLKPYNFIEFFKSLHGTHSSNIEKTSEFFKHSPLLVNNDTHAGIKKAFGTFYGRIESDIPLWLEEHLFEFLKGAKDKHYKSLIKLVDDCVSNIFEKIISRELSLESAKIPKITSSIFYFAPTKDEIKNFEFEISQLHNFLQERFKVLNKHENEIWPLISILIMGRDALINSIIFGVIKMQDSLTPWSALELFFKSAPISVIGRVACESLSINDLHITKGQEIYFLIIKLNKNESNDNAYKNSFSFGDGVHSCPGKGISLMIVETFFKEWFKVRDQFNFESRTAFDRDFILRGVDK